ncbi:MULTISPECIES: flagellar export protein FliJ [unclassified Treponema]|uniref:flagellar export protein FliJ n=1 Tax=unclassified Treponema TaxID=2638727 RepID=UPI0005300ECD|nr:MULTISPECIES: flagellar export protein FliJ [unclassified Treponema]AIW88606.1 flagellar export protein FliJ [Treponema sp. OMZ 838]UTC51387.1 flagellar export protein FliJ [Treponema sp. OMZ 855]
MKKFQFTLQKLLDIRAFREKEAETNLGRAVAAREAIVLRLAEIAQEEVKTRRSLWSSLKTPGELSLHENYLTRLHTEREKQEKALVEAELVVEEMRKIYIKAHQERLIVSKLRERKEAEWKAEGLKQQDAILDDIVNAREYRKSQNIL